MVFQWDVDRVEVKNLTMSVYQTFISPLLPKREIAHFRATPYLCHLAVSTLVKNYFEG